MRFAVGIKLDGKSEHVVVESKDALLAALEVKLDYPAAMITYVRHQNRRGDARNPPHSPGDP